MLSVSVGVLRLSILKESYSEFQIQFGAKMTSYQRRCDVLSRRIGVNATSVLRHVPAWVSITEGSPDYSEISFLNFQ